MPPGIHPLPRLALLAAALAMAAPFAAQARGGGGSGGGGTARFHGGFGAMRGTGIPSFHGDFIAAPGPRGRHAGLVLRLGNPAALRGGRNFLRSVPGIPPLRGTALPPLTGKPVPPLRGGGFRGPEIWRRGHDGTWHHHPGFGHRARLSAGVHGFGVLAPVVGLPVVVTPYGVRAYGNSCNAEPYICPITPEAPVGTPCACPLVGGGVAQGWVE